MHFKEKNETFYVRFKSEKNDLLAFNEAFYDINTVIPMYISIPIISLVIDMNGPVAIAGSILKRSRVMGTSVPKMEANITTANKLIDTE